MYQTSVAMGELLTSSQLSLLMLPKYQLKSSAWGQNFGTRLKWLPSAAFSVDSSSRQLKLAQQFYVLDKQLSSGTKARVASGSNISTNLSSDSAGKEADILADTGDISGGGFTGDSGKGGGGGNNGGNDNSGSGESDKSEDDSKNVTPMSMSQKLTLGYAVLVGAGGVIGFLKSGSQKSLIAGGLSASLLYYVYTLLPTKPVFASALGLGLSVALLIVMGSRFKKSGKVFPAGIVSLVSLVMSGGYIHGFMRSAH